MKQIIILAIILSAITASTHAYANVVHSLNYGGVGASVEGSLDPGADHPQDVNLGLSLRYGYYFLVSGFLAYDAGYQFREKSWNQKAGVQLMILYWGLETGFCMKTKKVSDERKYFPGGYAGALFSYPLSDTHLISVSAGGNFYSKKRENELYVRTTAVYNFVTTE
ncbi:MAG TPA: hypothetical protein PKK43_10055 [Spirochaetota bacterium]|nr:hypothetical protein [Spirochaetota bacterium]